MDKYIEFIIAMLDMNEFDSFEAWFGQSEAKTRLDYDRYDHVLLVATTQIWEMNCWQMADEGFTFEGTSAAVDHMMLNEGVY